MTVTAADHRVMCWRWSPPLSSAATTSCAIGAIGIGPHSDARWAIDLLLGQLGYRLHIDEDGNVSLWSAADDAEELILPAHYRPVQAAK